MTGTQGERTSRVIVQQPHEGRDVALGAGGVVTLKVEGSESDGRLTAYEFTVPPRTAGPPLHLHQNWDEAFSILEGVMSFVIDNQEFSCPAGSFVFIPQGVPHTFWNAGDVSARQLTIFTPSGIEAYFDDVSAVLASNQPDALGEAERLMTRHDMVVIPHDGPAYGRLED